MWKANVHYVFSTPKIKNFAENFFKNALWVSAMGIYLDTYDRLLRKFYAIFFISGKIPARVVPLPSAFDRYQHISFSIRAHRTSILIIGHNAGGVRILYNPCISCEWVSKNIGHSGRSPHW